MWKPEAFTSQGTTPLTVEPLVGVRETMLSCVPDRVRLLEAVARTFCRSFALLPVALPVPVRPSSGTSELQRWRRRSR